MAESAPTKVFVGNLSFKTTKNDLAATFSQAGKVVDANIITRGLRSLGYGFVDFESKEAADKAISTLHKCPLDGREINVELAKPADPSRPSRTSTSPRGGRGGSGFRGRGRGRGGYGSSRGRGGRGGFRGGRGGRSPSTYSKPRTPSTTTVFATNLPFSLEDKELHDLFADFAVKSAYIVRRENNRSKGFGFVEFETEKDQQSALEKMNKQQVQGRELILRIAYIENPPRDQAGSNPPAQAAASGASQDSSSTQTNSSS